jgi:hypothetical protein
MNSRREISRIKADNVSGAIIENSDLSQPVILESAAGDWEAIEKWSPTYFSQAFGEVQIAYRKSSSNLHPNLDREAQDSLKPQFGTMTEFLEFICASGSESSSYFLTGDGQTNTLFGESGVNSDLARLLSDMSLANLLPMDRLHSIGLWLSAANSCSWLHYDSGGFHNLNVQITGCKEVVLFSPEEISSLYMRQICDSKGVNFSRINIENSDYSSYPNFKNACQWWGKLVAGDCLLLPAFWSHSFKGLAKFNSNVNIWWKPEEQTLNVASFRSAVAAASSQVFRALKNGQPNSAIHDQSARVVRACVDAIEAAINSHTLIKFL